ncbi:flavin reductase family protein [Ornithinibacillus contaminans]|uniref:flavin reductase family protein n=1 Tax=Ornithinibacillus contaminans TaxID=694055 RepID=UPI00064DE36A|nr:flavin reductase family protein [Ornithinibacillus contaminans]
MDDRIFRNAMGKFTTGVTVVTTKLDDEVHGMTANAFMSVSLNPKLVLVSIANKAMMKTYITHAQKFAISILSQEQKDLSAYFAGQINETRTIYFQWFQEMPTIKDSLVQMICEVHDVVDAGDHTLYIGKVTDINTHSGDPLTFFEGNYHELIKGNQVK